MRRLGISVNQSYVAGRAVDGAAAYGRVVRRVNASAGANASSANRAIFHPVFAKLAVVVAVVAALGAAFAL